MIPTLTTGQSGYNYYKRSDRVGSNNEKAFLYFKKAYYDHIWTWTKAGSDSAIFYLQQAIKEDSLYGAAYAFLGHVYKFKTYDGTDGDEFKNQKWYAEKALQLSPKLGDAYTLMATVKWTEGDTASALNYLRQAVKIEPDHVGNPFWLAWRFSVIPEKRDSAIYYFHHVLKLDPEYGQVYMKLANLYESENKIDSSVHYYKKAIYHYQHVVPRDLRMVSGYFGLAVHLKNEYRNYDSAASTFRTYIRELLASDFMAKDEFLSWSYNLLTECYQQMAVNEMHKLIQHNENRLKGHEDNYDRIYAILESYQYLNLDSINRKYTYPLTLQLRSAASTETQRKEALFFQIELLKNMENLKEAIAVLHDYNTRSPKDIWVLFEGGKLYAMVGENKRSLALLTEVKQLIKTNSDREKFKEKLNDKEFDTLRENKGFKKLMVENKS
jgi:lipopolysaccharide biosynthesis regulator YciM